MRTGLVCSLLSLASVFPALAITVNVSAPANNTTTVAPVAVRAAATPTSGYVITGWHIYVDSKDSYSSGGVSSISTNLAVSNGTHSIVVRAWDSSGADASQTLSVNVVSQGVSVSVSEPSNNSTVFSPVDIRANAVSGHPITGWHVYVDNTDSFTGGATTDLVASIPMSPGAHTVIIRAWDSTGANGDQTLKVTAAASSITVNVSSPGNGATVSSPATIQASATSPNTITGWHVYVDSTDVFTGGQTDSISPSLPLAPGPHTLVIRAWDSSGADASQTLSVNAVEGISVTATAPSNGATVSSPVAVQASASSGNPITGWHIYVDSVDSFSAGAVNSINASLAMSNGPHTLVIRAWDSSGAFGDQTVQVNVVSAGVSVTVSEPLNNSTVSSPVTVNASANSTNPITGWHIYVDNADVFGQTNVSSISTALNLAAGPHTLVIRAWDSTGANGDQTLTLTVPSTPPPPPPGQGYFDLDDIPAWTFCGGGCADTGGSGAQPTLEQNVVSKPSEDGSAHEFSISAPSTLAGQFPNAYWYLNRVPTSNPPSPTKLATQLTYSFDLYMPSVQPGSSATPADQRPQAIEWEIHQQFGGTVYNMGWQALYAGVNPSSMEMRTYQWKGSSCSATGVPASGWYNTGILFPRFTLDTWHSVQVDYHISGSTIFFDDIIIDGVKKVPTQAATHVAVPCSVGNKFNNAFQQDMNKAVDPWIVYIDHMNVTYQ